MEGRRWSPDACFYDAFLDLVALEQYIKILDVELPGIVEAERKRIWQDVKAGDEEGENYASFAEYQLDEGIATRLLTATSLIATWATYESIVSRSAEHIRESKGLRLTRWKRGKGTFLEKAQRYFNIELRCYLHSPDTDWDRLNAIRVLRNALAHANGQLEDCSNREQVEKLVISYPGLKIIDSCLIISIVFIRSVFQFVEQLLLDLGHRADHVRNQNGRK